MASRELERINSDIARLREEIPDPPEVYHDALHPSYQPKPMSYYTCSGLQVDLLRRALAYNPETGALIWREPYNRRGGVKKGTQVLASSMMIAGFIRNTFGVIYLIHRGELPTHRIAFRDGNGTNWSWRNISPLEEGEYVPFLHQPVNTRR